MTDLDKSFKALITSMQLRSYKPDGVFKLEFDLHTRLVLIVCMGLVFNSVFQYSVLQVKYVDTRIFFPWALLVLNPPNITR